LTSCAAARESDVMKAVRYTLRPQHPESKALHMRPPVYAMRFELPEPRKGMIRAFILDVLAATLAVTAGLALMVDG
jgi:hypothetical protein